MIVEDFAWAEIDPVTAEWFYGVVRLLASCKVMASDEESFATTLARSSGKFTFWQESHDHELHTVSKMWSALRTRFQSLNETHAPHLYRYLCPVLAESEAGYAIASQVFEMEARLAQLGAIKWVGRRFVGAKV